MSVIDSNVLGQDIVRDHQGHNDLTLIVPSIRWISQADKRRKTTKLYLISHNRLSFIFQLTLINMLRKSLITIVRNLSLTLQPTARSMLRATMVDKTAATIFGWSSRTAGQKVITKTEPDRQRATTIENQRSHSNGRIHNTLGRSSCVQLALAFRKNIIVATIYIIITGSIQDYQDTKNNSKDSKDASLRLFSLHVSPLLGCKSRGSIHRRRQSP